MAARRNPESDNTVMYIALAAAAYIAYEYFYSAAAAAPVDAGSSLPPAGSLPSNPGPVSGPATAPPATGQVPQAGPSATPPTTLVTDQLAAAAQPYGGTLTVDQWAWYMRRIAGKDDAVGAAEFPTVFASLPDNAARITLDNFVQNGGSDFWRVLTSTALTGIGPSPLGWRKTGTLSGVVRGRRPVNSAAGMTGMAGYLDRGTASPVRIPLSAPASTWGD